MKDVPFWKASSAQARFCSRKFMQNIYLLICGEMPCTPSFFATCLNKSSSQSNGAQLFRKPLDKVLPTWERFCVFYKQSNLLNKGATFLGRSWRRVPIDPGVSTLWRDQRLATTALICFGVYFAKTSRTAALSSQLLDCNKHKTLRSAAFPRNSLPFCMNMCHWSHSHCICG